MTLQRFITLFILFEFFSIAHAQSDGWPQPKQGLYIQLSEWWMVSDKHFDGDGNIQPNFTEYGYYATILNAEYGLSNRFTFLIQFPFLNYTYSLVPSTLDRQSILKMGDSAIGLKYALMYEKQTALCASFILGFPSGYSKGLTLQTGDGEFNQIVDVNAIHKFRLFSSDTWLDVHVGYNHRSREYADEIGYGMAWSILLPNNKVTAGVRFDGREAMGNPENASFINPQSLFSNFASYLNFSPKLTFHIYESLGTIIEAFIPLSGRNIFASPSYTLGISYAMTPQKSD